MDSPKTKASGRKPHLWAWLWLLAVACTPWRLQQQDQGPASDTLLAEETPQTFAEVRRLLLGRRPDIREFSQLGPVRYQVRENQVWTQGLEEPLILDNLIPRQGPPTPLAIIVHGNQSHKEAHRYQAERLASFGIHAVVVQVPNRNQWLRNGRLLAQLVKALRRDPQILGGHIAPDNLILVGHSFGGSAITTAAGRGAPVRGLVMLDPAVVSAQVKRSMRKVARPVLVLGADRRVFRSRKRRLFYRHLRGEVAEVSVQGATHDDAQYPSMYALSAYGFDPFTSEDKQETFATALTAGVFSLGATASLDYAWQAYAAWTERGALIRPRRRGPRGPDRRHLEELTRLTSD